MNTKEEETEAVPERKVEWKIVARNIAYIVATLLIFLFALDLMISALERVGKPVAETIILATSNPFTGLFIGLLVTAIIQSSSAATSVVVALVASGAISLEGAVPVIMGANIGTTITSAIVSLGFITKKKEFKRAVAAGTYHSFFNILTAVVLFPLEYYYGFLSKASQYLAVTFFNEPIGPMNTGFSFLGSGVRPVVDFLIARIDNGIILICISVLLIFGSIVFFRKVLSNILGFGVQGKFQRFFFRNALKSFGWGVLTTAAIRSSTVTTSLVVPLVARKIVKMKAAVPFILGANVGTTITAFIAAMFNSNAAISIAIAHFLFNFIGVLIFFPIPYLRAIPVNLATGLGELTRRNWLTGFAYLLLTFFFIPFTLIYLNKKAIVIRELTYEQTDNVQHQRSTYSIITKTVKNQNPDSWATSESYSDEFINAEKVETIYRKRNRILIGRQSFDFNPVGYCRDGRDHEGAYSICVRQLLPTMPWGNQRNMDSVYVFEKRRKSPSVDSGSWWYYISAKTDVLLKREKRSSTGDVLRVEVIVSEGKK